MKLKYVVPAVALLALSLSACAPKNVDPKTGCSTLAVTAADLATPEQKTAYTYGVLLGSMPVTFSAVSGAAMGAADAGLSNGEFTDVFAIISHFLKTIDPNEAFDSYIAQSKSTIPYTFPMNMKKMGDDPKDMLSEFTKMINGSLVGALVYQAQKNSGHAVPLQTPERDKCLLMAGYQAASLANPDSAKMLGGDLTKYLIQHFNDSKKEEKLIPPQQ